MGKYPIATLIVEISWGGSKTLQNTSRFEANPTQAAFQRRAWVNTRSPCRVRLPFGLASSMPYFQGFYNNSLLKNQCL
jgi:hypothetical protein